MNLDQPMNHVDRLRLALALSETYEEREFECEPEYLEALLADFDAQRAEIERLRDLVLHCSIHSAYRECGRDQMTSEQKAIFDAIVRANGQLTQGSKE